MTNILRGPLPFATSVLYSTEVDNRVALIPIPVLVSVPIPELSVLLILVKYMQIAQHQYQL